MSAPTPITGTPDPHAIDAQLVRALAELRAIREILAGARKPLLTVAEVARMAGRDEYTVRRWISGGRLPATRVAAAGPRGASSSAATTSTG